MNICTRAAGKALEEIVYQLHLQISDTRRTNFGIDNRRSAPTEINRGKTERFVHRHDKVTGAQNTAAISESLVKDLAQSDADVFHRVVLIHIQVADRGEFQIESAMPRKQFHHVVEKTDSGGDFIFAATFDGERNPNLRLRGFAMQIGFPHTFTSLDNLSFPATSRRALINI
jgi:hypothetical protein